MPSSPWRGGAAYHSRAAAYERESVRDVLCPSYVRMFTPDSTGSGSVAKIMRRGILAKLVVREGVDQHRLDSDVVYAT